jgi:hypothetical protein
MFLQGRPEPLIVALLNHRQSTALQPLPPLLFGGLPRRIALISGRFLLGQEGGLGLESLGFGPRPRLSGFSLGLRGKFRCTDRLRGQFRLVRLLRGFPRGDASSAFCQHCFSRLATLDDRRIVRSRGRAESLQNRFLCGAGIDLPLPKVRQRVLFHYVSSLSIRKAYGPPGMSRITREQQALASL